MRRNLGYVLWVSVLIAGLSTVPATKMIGQTAATGALRGTVTDSTGAVIPNVSVTATETETEQERTAITNADGTYNFALLPPGTYRVRFAATGFKVTEVPAVKVNVTETPVLDRALEVGAQAEAVTVEANATAIQTTNSTMGTVVGSSTVTGLPLTTRNYTNILGLSAGANASVNNATGLGKGTMEIAVNGARTDQNTFQMDGVSIVNYASNGVQGQSATYATFGVPNPDALQEFKIQTSLYDAGYGRNPGANVNVISKSGTNEFHGTAFEFFRNTDLNANDFFRNRSGGSKLVLNQNQFGGVVGGPIKKDKLFFFASYQQTWQKNGAASQGFSPGITLVPIPQGDRSNTAAFQQELGTAFCPSNHPGDSRYLTNPGGAGAGQGMQVACDGSNINPIAVKFLQAKNADGSYFIPSSTTGGFQPGVTFSAPAYDKEYQGMFNIDYAISAKNTLAARYYRSYEPQNINFLGPIGTLYLPGVPATDPFGYHNGVLKLTSLIGNSLVNEARVSYQRTTTDAFQNPPTSTYASAIGITPIGSTLPYSPVLNFQGLFQAGGSSSNDESVHNLQYQAADQISWVHGKHTIRVGGEIEQANWSWDYFGLSRGIMAFQTFGDFLIGLPGACGPAVAGACNGSAFSNILNTNNFSVRSGPGGIVHGYRAKDANWFFQDDFKVSQRLTLNLGVRWEYDGLPSDKYGNLVNLWLSAIQAVPVPGNSPATGSYAGWVVPSNYQSQTWGTPPAGVINSGHLIASKNSIPLDDFAPRFGFAWQPLDNNRFVVRGGYGFFYDRVPGNTIIHAVEQSPPYSITLDQGASTNQFASLKNPFQSIPLGTFPIRWVNFANNTGSDLTQTSLLDNFLTPLVYSWNLNFQYEIAPTWVVEAGYVGSHGIHQAETLHFLNEAQLASAANPVNGVTTNTVSNARLRVPYLGFSPTGLQYADTAGSYKYSSLQLTLRKAFSHGLTFQAAYTFSRAFTDQTYNTGTPPGPGYSNSGDPLNLSQQYGLNPQYRPQRFVVSYSWDIPSGHVQGLAGKLISGWSLQGITTIQGGQPLSIFDSRGGAIFGLAGATAVGASRAQLAPGVTYANLVTPGGVENRLGGLSGGPGYINASALTTIPAIGGNGTPGTGGTGWGNSGVGVFFGPGQLNFDTTLAKTTRVGGLRENAALQFRAEFFNLLNHPQFNIPAGLNFAAPGNFGQITSTSVNPRLIQLALKYIF
jgi:hypothetical protein